MNVRASGYHWILPGFVPDGRRCAVCNVKADSLHPDPLRSPWRYRASLGGQYICAVCHALEE